MEQPAFFWLCGLGTLLLSCLFISYFFKVND